MLACLEQLVDPRTHYREWLGSVRKKRLGRKLSISPPGFFLSACALFPRWCTQREDDRSCQNKAKISISRGCLYCCVLVHVSVHVLARSGCTCRQNGESVATAEIGLRMEWPFYSRKDRYAPKLSCPTTSLGTFGFVVLIYFSPNQRGAIFVFFSLFLASSQTDLNTTHLLPPTTTLSSTHSLIHMLHTVVLRGYPYPHCGVKQQCLFLDLNLMGLVAHQVTVTCP